MNKTPICPKTKPETHNDSDPAPTACSPSVSKMLVQWKLTCSGALEQRDDQMELKKKCSVKLSVMHCILLPGYRSNKEFIGRGTHSILTSLLSQMLLLKCFFPPYEIIQYMVLWSKLVTSRFNFFFAYDGLFRCYRLPLFFSNWEAGWKWQRKKGPMITYSLSVSSSSGKSLNIKWVYVTWYETIWKLISCSEMGG